MAKKTNSSILDVEDTAQEVDQELAEITREISPAKPSVEPLPTFEELMSAPKTKATGGDGTGGRPYVCSKAKDGGLFIRVMEQGDQARPQCPNCTNDQVAVLCVAYSSPVATTRYKCPMCSFSAQKLRPGVAEAMQKQAKIQPSKPFVQRP